MWDWRTTVYIGAHYEKNLTANTTTSYYFAGSQRVATRQGGVVYSACGRVYLHADHLGSTSLATDASAGVVVPNSATRYYPYGSTRSGGSGLPTPYRFTAQYSAESSLGLYFYNARWYDPYLGRFVSADTIVPQPGNPQSLNRYSYVLGNPLKYVDPTGHLSTQAIAQLLGVTEDYLLNSDLWKSWQLDRYWMAVLNALKPGDRLFASMYLNFAQIRGSMLP